MRENIILVGYMGSGKSTVGIKLAKLYGMKFFDTDEMIEEKAGMKISEIFEKYGEAAFRDMETELIREAASWKNAVISTGGGMPVREENRELLKKAGAVIYLKTDAKTTVSRLMPRKEREEANDDAVNKRPLLAGSDEKELYEKAKKMIEIRKPMYIDAANIIIETDGRSLYQVIDDIKTQLRKRNKSSS